MSAAGAGAASSERAAEPAPRAAPRTVVVTGAAGHLGRAVADTLARGGARLVLVDRREDALAQAFGRADGHARVAVDLLDARAVQDAIDDAARRLGGVDALCHLAGGFRMGEAVHETTDATWDLLFDVNARTLVNVARAVVPHLLRGGGGRIVAVGAAAAQRGVARMGAYCASKSSVVRLVEAMSEELKAQGINVNCVLPTIIDTPDNRAAMPDADPARWVAPAALAEVVAFLLSDGARAIHGAALPVSGLA